MAYFGISNFVQYVNVFTDNNTQVHKIKKDNIIITKCIWANYDTRKISVLIDMYCLNKILCNKP